MAKNPTVDGITNIAIPDSPYGVHMEGLSIPGTLFGIEAVIEGILTLRNARIDSVNLTGAQIKNALLDELSAGYLTLSNANFSARISLARAKIARRLNMSNATFGADVVSEKMEAATLDLEGIKVTGDVMLLSVKVHNDAYLSEAQIGGSLYLTNAHFSKAGLGVSGLYVSGNALFEDAVIPRLMSDKGTGAFVVDGKLIVHGLSVEYFEGKIAAREVVGRPKSIPENLQTALDNAPETYSRLKGAIAAEAR